MFLLFNIFLFLNTNPLILIEKKPSNVKESSAIFWDNKKLYVLGDSGQLLISDDDTSSYFALDFEDSEGIYVSDEHIFVTEERSRKVVILEKETLKKIAEKYIPFSGRLNRGFEGITYNTNSKEFIVITEENPCQIIRLDKDFNTIAYHDLQISEASDITFFKNNIWVISDLNATIYKLNCNNFNIEESWAINVLNPEGITFSENQMIVVSDNLEKIYYYEIPH